MLTDNQLRVCEVLITYDHYHRGLSPSLAELLDLLGWTSRSSLESALRRLEQLEMITRETGKARSIRLRHMGEGIMYINPARTGHALLRRVTAGTELLFCDRHAELIAQQVGYPDLQIGRVYPFPPQLPLSRVIEQRLDVGPVRLTVEGGDGEPLDLMIWMKAGAEGASDKNVFACHIALADDAIAWSLAKGE